MAEANQNYIHISCSLYITYIENNYASSIASFIIHVSIYLYQSYSLLSYLFIQPQGAIFLLQVLINTLPRDFVPCSMTCLYV